MKCILSILSLLFFLSSTVLGQTEETYEVTYVDSVGTIIVHTHPNRW